MAREQPVRVVEPLAAESAVDATDPVAHEVAERRELELLDQRLPRVRVQLEHRLHESFEQLLVTRQLDDDLRELARLGDAVESWRAAETPAEAHALLAAEPAAQEILVLEHGPLGQDPS